MPHYAQSSEIPSAEIVALFWSRDRETEYQALRLALYTAAAAYAEVVAERDEAIADARRGMAEMTGRLISAQSNAAMLGVKVRELEVELVSVRKWVPMRARDGRFFR